MSSVQVRPSRLGEEKRAVPRLCILDPGIWLTTQGKSRKNLSQSIRKALGQTGPSTIRLVDSAIDRDGLDWPAGPSRPWL